MGWWQAMKGVLGKEVKPLDKMTDQEMKSVKRDLDISIQKLEKQLDANDEAQRESAKQVLQANSQPRKIVAVEKLKAVKNQGKIIAKAYVIRSRYLQGIDNIITLKSAVGVLSEGLSNKLQDLDPSAISSYLATLGDDMERRSYDAEDISCSLDDMTADMGDLAKSDDLTIIEELQDDVLNDDSMSEEDKIKRLMEM